MKTLVFLYVDSNSLHLFDKVFDGNSAFYRSLKWADSVCDSVGTVVLTCDKYLEKVNEEIRDFNDVYVCSQSEWNVTALLEKISSYSKENNAENIVYSFGDCPFLNLELTKSLIETHTQYCAEYTFADGYPYGLAPEVISSDVVNLLLQLNKNELVQEVKKDSLFALIKTDINSFEVETILSEDDWRLFRMSFDCSSLQGMKACQALFDMNLQTVNPDEISKCASENVKILKTVPSFYNVEICGKCSGLCSYCPHAAEGKKSTQKMNIDSFKTLVKQISDFSENAVVSLSAFGEPLLHPEFEEFVKAVLMEPGLSVLVETDGINLNEQIIKEIAELANSVPHRRNGYEKIMWIVSIDAMTKETYGLLRGSEEKFGYANAIVALLQNYFPGSVYPQMVRMNENEHELESFYRFWNEKTSPSGGNLVIQKYSNYCKSLPDRKPADLSPIERNPCWHLRRDLTIRADGSVPVCKEKFGDGFVGNVFSEDIKTVWEKLTPLVEQHLKQDYSNKCEDCDEYYTFNF